MDPLIVKSIDNFIKSYRHVDIINWGKPLVAYARAGDPLFATLKDVASPTHVLPQDFLPEAETVITYFVPFSEIIVESNKKGRFSSEIWARAYIETNKMIAALNEHLQQILRGHGYETAFMPPTHNFDENTLLCNWSHRSAAYIAGLGTFGLNHMLITASGCCGRIGSLITDLELEPTRRPETEYCLYMQNQSCGKCAKKCVNNALHLDNLYKFKCNEMLLSNADHHGNLESIADVCGKCLVGVPCSTSIPSKDS